MLNKVEARTAQGLLLSLPLSDISSGYVVQEIDGLDPVPANIVSSSFARLDGDIYQSSRREKRTLMFRLGLEADYTNLSVRELRNQLYQYFMPKRDVYLKFYTSDFPTVDISGRVETFDSALFAKDPSAAMTITCFDPDFYDATGVTTTAWTTSSATMGHLTYSGSVDSGVNFEMIVDRSITGFTIYHQPAGESVRTMQVSGAFVAGDKIQINTIPGQKRADLYRGGVLSSMLHLISPYSDWMRLQPGDNAYRVQLAGTSISYTLKYTNKYGGL